MSIRTILLSFYVGYSLALIGTSSNSLNRKITSPRLETLTLRDSDIGNEIFPEDNRRNVPNSIPNNIPNIPNSILNSIPSGRFNLKFSDSRESKSSKENVEETSKVNKSFSNNDTKSLSKNKKEIKTSSKDHDSSFTSRLKTSTSHREFTLFLKSTAQKRTNLSPSDRQHVVDELLLRVPLMSVHSVSDALWSIGTLKIPVKTDHLSAVTDMLLASLDAHQHAMTSEDMALALVGLARLGIRCPSTPPTPHAEGSSSFLESLPRTMLSMDAMQVANCMWALGKYGVTWDSLTLKVQKAYKAAIVRVGPKMSPLAVANTIHGLSNQRAKWGSLPGYLTEALSRALEINIKGMHEQEVSNCISGLGRLGAEWTDFSPTIRRSLGDAFLRTIGENDLPPRGLAMSVHGLGRMNADFISLPSNFRSSIMSAIHKISPKVNSLEVSNILYGLGKMGTSFSVDEVNMGNEAAASAASGSPGTLLFTVPGLAMKGVSSEELDLSIAGRGAGRGSGRGAQGSLTGSPGRGFEADTAIAVGLSRKARESILDALNREAFQMTTQGITNSLWGLMLMDAHWWILSPTLQTTVLKVVLREVGRMTEQELCNVVYALGRLGLRWSDFSSEVRKSLLLAVEARSEVMAPAGVVMTLLGLGRMYFTWGEMSPSLVLALSNAIERVLHSASERTLSGLVHALATVGAQWEDLSPTLQLAVLDGISKGQVVKQDDTIVTNKAAHQTKAPTASIVSPKIKAPKIVSPKTGRSPERASRAAYGADAILSIKTVHKWAAAPLEPKAHSTAPAPTWSQTGGDDNSKSLSTSSLLKQKSSRAAAALLLGPSPILEPTALVAIQEMISPPNLDMHSFKALIQSQLAQPVIEAAQVTMVPAQKRCISQPVDANELEFYKAVANKPKIIVPKAEKMSLKLVPPMMKPPSVKNKVRDGLFKADRKQSKKGIKGMKGFKKDDMSAVKLQRVQKTKKTVTRTTLNSAPGSGSSNIVNKNRFPVASISALIPASATVSSSGVVGNHLVYSLGQMGVSWAQLGAETRNTLSDSLVLSLPVMAEMGVVNSLHGLTNLGAKWRDLRADVQTAFQAALKRVSDDMGEQGVSVAILSLAKLDVNWLDDLEEPLKLALKKATARQAHIGEHALSSLLYGLGKLSRTWLGLPSDVRHALKESIVVCHLNDRCTPQGVANSLHGLASMQVTWGILSSSVRLALFAEICKAVPSATQTQLSNIIGSLGKMGLQWEALNDQLKSRIITALTAKAESLNEWHLSTLLFSLGSMGLNWQSLPSILRSSFINALLRVNTVRGALTQTEGTLKNYLNVEDINEGGKRIWKPKSAATVDYDELLPVVEYIMRKEKKDTKRGYNSRSNASKNPRVSAEREKELQMNAQGVSMTIVGMSRLAATYNQLPSSLVHSISISLQGALPSMNCAQVSASVSGLSKAQWRWDSLIEGLKEALLRAVSRTASTSTPLDMAILMNGLGTMGIRWIALPAETKFSLQIGIKRTSLIGAADEVAGVTFGLGMMDVSWNVLPFDMKRSLKDGILRVCGASPLESHYPHIPDFSPGPSASSGITGAAHFAASTKTSSSSVSSSSTSSSSASSSSPSISSFSVRDNVRDEAYDSESSSLMAASDRPVRARVERHSSAHTPHTQHTLNTQNTPHTPAQTPQEIQALAVQNMPPQALANLMYAISLLIFEESQAVHEELTPVHIALLDTASALGVGSSLFTEAEKEQILIYISTLQTLTPLKDSVTHRPKCILRADKPFTKPSKLQQTVVSALTTALMRKNSNFEVEDEYSAFSGAFPVDATIFEGNKPVAFVEVNGPQHYREDGRLRRKDLMKEALYRSKYPDASFTRVRFDQVNRLGSRYVGVQVAHFISNTPPVRVRCTAAAGVCTSFFPLFSPSNSADSCTVMYQDCEEDGLAARRAERELVQALSIEGNKDIGAWLPACNNIHSHAHYLSESS